MGRYLALVLITLLISGNGCHKATGPSDNFSNSNDTASTVFGSHYTIANVMLKNIDMTHLLVSDDQVYHTHSENRDTSMRYCDHFNGTFFLDTSSRINRKKLLIQFIEVHDSIPSNGHYLFFINLPFDLKSDSSIVVTLSGLLAETYISEISYSYQIGNPREMTGESFDFYKCTDSTQIEITLPYKK